MSQNDPALLAAARRILQCYRVGDKLPIQWLDGKECNQAINVLKGVVQAIDWVQQPAQAGPPPAFSFNPDSTFDMAKFADVKIQAGGSLTMPDVGHIRMPDGQVLVVRAGDDIQMKLHHDTSTGTTLVSADFSREGYKFNPDSDPKKWDSKLQLTAKGVEATRSPCPGSEPHLFLPEWLKACQHPAEWAKYFCGANPEMRVHEGMVTSWFKAAMEAVWKGVLPQTAYKWGDGSFRDTPEPGTTYSHIYEQGKGLRPLGSVDEQNKKLRELLAEERKAIDGLEERVRASESNREMAEIRVRQLTEERDSLETQLRAAEYSRAQAVEQFNAQVEMKLQLSRSFDAKEQELSSAKSTIQNVMSHGDFVAKQRDEATALSHQYRGERDSLQEDLDGIKQALTAAGKGIFPSVPWESFTAKRLVDTVISDFTYLKSERDAFFKDLNAIKLMMTNAGVIAQVATTDQHGTSVTCWTTLEMLESLISQRDSARNAHSTVKEELEQARARAERYLLGGVDPRAQAQLDATLKNISEIERHAQAILRVVNKS